MTIRCGRIGRILTSLILVSLALALISPSNMLARGQGASTKASKVFVRCKHRVKAKGTLKYSDWQFPDSLNPFQASEAVSFATINGTEDSLFFYNQSAKLVPQISETIPSIKNHGITGGGKTIVITLKKGVRWSNGAELTASDIKFSWQVSSDTATGPACTGTCDQIRSMTVNGRYQVVAHMKTVYAAAIPSAFQFVLVPGSWQGAWTKGDAHAAAAKLGQDNTFNFEGLNYPTNGAYQVAEYVNDDRIVLHPMKYYSTLSCGAAVQNLIFAFYSSKPGMIAAAASKETDITGFGGGYTAADLPDLRKHTDAYRLYSQASFNYEFLELNHDAQYNGSPNPLHNAKVRLALALALDKIGLIKSALAVTTKQAKSVIAWTPWVNTPGLVQPYAYRGITGQWDPIAKKFVNPGTAKALADAKKLLNATPYKSGFNLDLFTTSGNPVRVAEVGVVSNNWKRLGVNIVPTFVPSTKLFGDWNSGGIQQHGAFQVSLHGFVTLPEPDGNKSVLTTRYIDRRQQVHSIVNGNNSGIADPVIDKAFNTAGHTFDTKVRAANYKTVQLRMDQQAHWIMLYFRPSIATATRRVGNFSNNPTQEGPTWNAYSYRLLAS